MRSVQIGSDPEPTVETLAEAIRQPLHDLTAAAEEAEHGRLGGAKLGVLVAASGILKALQKIDAEFERLRGADDSARHDESPSRRKRS